MLLFKKTEDLSNYLMSAKQKGRLLGFVPTMGALHEGHISLVKQALLQSDMAIVSIFVNPSQFNDPEDLKKYPRTLVKDLEMLEAAGTHIVYAPSVEEVYPPGLDPALDVEIGVLAEVLEGAFRPGHFQGMMEVVNRLLDITMPHKLFMGQKDFQQAAIVNEMLLQTKRETELVICPIIREDNGLAMSSRNRRLSEEERARASILHESLNFVKENLFDHSLETLKQAAEEMISEREMRLDYFEIVDGYQMQNVDDITEVDYIVACLAAFMGEVRLIDNMILQHPQKVEED